MKKIVYYTGILVCIGVFLFSCIADDLSDCPPDGLVPQFILVPYEGNDITNDSLYSAKICVFDEQERFVATYHVEGRPELDKIYTPDWALPPGKYHFSVWLNYHENEKLHVDPCLVEQSLRESTTVGLIIPDTKIIDDPEKIPFLCYGKLDNQDITTVGYKRFTIPVMQFTNRINLKVTGLSNIPFLRTSTEENHEYEFSITDNNGIYGFDGDFVSQDNFTYSTVKRVVADTLEASLTVMKLSGTRHNPTITIRNSTTKESLLIPENLDLIELILSGNSNNDFDKTHVYDVVFSFVDPNGLENDISVMITVNDWVAVCPFDVELNIN
jgi:hypothetical protein